MSFDAARVLAPDDDAYFAYLPTVSTHVDPNAIVDPLLPTPWMPPLDTDAAGLSGALGGDVTFYDGRSHSQPAGSDEEERELASLLVADDDDEHDGGDAAAVAAGRRSKQLVLQRRRRNRESMRRSRMKEKEGLATLRTTLVELEQRYNVLTRYDGQSASSSSDARQTAALYKALQTKLSHAIQLKRELEAERTVVQRFLREREESAWQLSRVFATCNMERESAAVAERLAVLDAQARQYQIPRSLDASNRSSRIPFEFGFTPYSPVQVDALLRDFMTELARVKALAHQQPTGQEPTGPSSSFFLEVLGWQTHRHIDAQNQMHFEFTKPFFHLSTRDVVDRAWADAVDLKQYANVPKNGKTPSRIVQRMEFLQRVNHHVGLVVREIKHPEEDTVFRTHYALFMLETHDGFVFGIQSINPSAEQQQAFQDPAQKVVWVDVFIAIELLRHPRHHPTSLHDDVVVLPHTDAFRQDYCEVRWRGKTNYKTPKHAAENAVNFLMGVLRWEIDVVGPVFHLTAS